MPAVRVLCPVSGVCQPRPARVTQPCKDERLPRGNRRERRWYNGTPWHQPAQSAPDCSVGSGRSLGRASSPWCDILSLFPSLPCLLAGLAGQTVVLCPRQGRVYLELKERYLYY